jgi:hypothetical protein
LDRISFSDAIGIAGIVFAIVLLVLDKAGKLKGGWLLGLLLIAGAMTLFVAIGNSWVLDAPAKWRVWRGLCMCSLVAFAYSGVAIWISVTPQNEAPSTETLETPSPKVDAYIQPGSSNPYPPQAILGGIVWDDKYVDVRLDIGVGAVAIQNLDFEVALDTSIAGIGQISQLADVTSFPDGRQIREPTSQTPEASKQTLRLTLEYERQDVRLVAGQRVVMIPPPSESQTLHQGQSGTWIELRDANEAVLYQRVLHNPIRYAVEEPEREETGRPRWHKIENPRGTFQLLVPDLPTRKR